jgi:hypothetical protein
MIFSDSNLNLPMSLTIVWFKRLNFVLLNVHTRNEKINININKLTDICLDGNNQASPLTIRLQDISFLVQYKYTQVFRHAYKIDNVIIIYIQDG